MKSTKRSNRGADSAEGSKFKPVRPSRSHEHVAEQLRRHISLGLVPPGMAFPPERDLARTFRVSRATIHAALKELEAEGRIESRRGRGGGNFVVGLTGDDAGHQRMLAEIRENGKTISDALELREIIEIGAVRLAARSATTEQVAQLKQIAKRGSESATDLEFHHLDTEFHIALGRATQNELIAHTVEDCRLKLNMAILAQPATDSWHERINEEHAQLTAAIEAGDPDLAAEVMSRHLDRTVAGIRAMLVALRAEPAAGEGVRDAAA